MTFPTVVGVTGFAHHGKDTFAARLVERWGFKRFAFADPIKSLAYTLNPIVARGGVAGFDRLANVVDAAGWEEAKNLAEVRRFLQVLGTEGVRNHLGDDSWVKACGQSFLADGAERVVIADTRFPKEVEYVRSVCGGVMVRVTRPGFDNGIGADHPSEMHVPSLPVDFEVVNDGDVTDLCAKADAIAADIEEGFGHRVIGEWLGVPVVTDARLRVDEVRMRPVSVHDVTDEPVTTEYEAAKADIDEALRRRYRRNA